MALGVPKMVLVLLCVKLCNLNHRFLNRVASYLDTLKVILQYLVVILMICI